MASADLKEELECSICLDIYTDPVTLICGHNFCQDCIGRVLDSQEGSGGYFCPDCREDFQERPTLRRNITLRNIVENVQSTHPDQEESGVFCTYCIHTPVPAVKSCLLCEASLCYDHLRVHSKSPDHVLCDPTTSLENRKRSSSENVLCDPTTSLDNRKCSSSEHVLCGPTTSPENRKYSSEHVLSDPTTSMENRKYYVYKAGRPYVVNIPGVNVEKCTGTYVYPHSTTQGKGHINAEPSRRCPQPTQAIQPSRRYPQPSPTIQPSRRYPQPSPTIQPSRRYPQPSPTIQPSRRYPQPTIQHSHRQAGGGPNILSDIMCGVNVQKCADTEVYPHSSAKEMLPFTAKPSWKHPETASTIQHSHRQAGGPNIKSVQQTSGVADIVWDWSTASNHLGISDDGKTVYKSPYKLFPETLWCFRCSQVMSITNFSSGRHYWEVDVGESPIWKVGMCYTSIDRRGIQSGLGCNNKSWCLEKRRFNEYSFVHDSYQYPLPGGISSNRVRIDLDYEAGQISFYDLCNPIQHLHTFTNTFTEPLHAAMRVGKNSCIRIIGGEYKGKNLYKDW